MYLPFLLEKIKSHIHLLFSVAVVVFSFLIKMKSKLVESLHHQVNYLLVFVTLFVNFDLIPLFNIS